MVAKLLWLIVLITVLSTTGCTNYSRDINKTLLITSVLVDAGDGGAPKIYFEGFRPHRGSAKEEKKDDRVIFMVSGKSIAEAIDSLNTLSSNKPDFGHNKVVLFSKRAAELGLAKYIDLFARQQGLLLRSYVAIYDGKPAEIFEAKLPGDKYLGLYGYDLFRYSNSSSAKIIEATVRDVFNGRYEYSRTSVIPMLTIVEQTGKIPAVDGAAVIRDFQLVAVLLDQELPYYNMFQDAVEPYAYTIENPAYPGSYISLQTAYSSFQTRVDYDGEVILLKKKIKINLILSEAQNTIDLTPEQRTQIKTLLAQQIKTECNALFNKYKAQSVDIFNLEEMFRRKYPEANIDNPLARAELKLVIDLNIEGSSHYKYFY